MAVLTVYEIARAVEGALLQGDPDLRVASLSIDSRTVLPGELFFAIPGPRFDGHQFVAAAAEKGAVGAVVSRDIPSFPGVRIRVADTHRALRELASHVRARWDGTMVGVTGSSGKTSTKEYIAELLSDFYAVHRSPGNLNNLYGLPLSLYGLDVSHQVAVFEMAMNHPGEIAELCAIAHPQVGVLTNVNPVHLGFFRSLEHIAEAKGELIRALPPDGMAIYNQDDPLVRGAVDRFQGRKIPFGLDSGAAVRATEVSYCGLTHTALTLHLDSFSGRARLNLLGRHNVYNALAAAAVAFALGVPAAEIALRLSRLRPYALRGVVLAFAAGFSLLDDSYNSNPNALKELVRTVASQGSFLRKIVVAGEMLELGDYARSLHQHCGRDIGTSGVDWLIGVQGEARTLAAAAIRAGMPEDRVRFFETADEAADYLLGFLREGDLVLVKGSRGVRTDRIVERLKERYALEDRKTETLKPET
ncbi:MAG: UDP-N-acetylmuramoyl-tripeptide--D-alanyl-D-alanine ligase [Acidobacteria bacterium]|nr:UDP-N-acetylmuramoyl-tripeptide--D-alanyl-D-alanine ligase [Acidobacteriota bacterium]